MPRPKLNLRCRSLLVTALAAAFLPSAGLAKPYLPPAGKIFQGVAGQPISAYQNAVRKHPAVYQEFVAWGQYLPAITHDASAAHARLMIHITTAFGSREAITPGGIAAGDGDNWLIGLNHAISSSGLVTYVRLMAEMDAYWNPYGAFNADGSHRDANHSTAAYRRAWKRVTLIMRGGSLSTIDATLKRLGMPPLHTSSDLPTPKVAMVWCPQVAGAPDIAGNQPSDFWPGSRWVDWVATDFYSNAPNFSGLDSLYGAYSSKPFAFGEYALWGADDPGWVDQLFSWVRGHRRTQMLIYNQGIDPNGPFRLSRYPNASGALRQQLASSRFPAFAPELKP
jgi:hypothetical protein